MIFNVFLSLMLYFAFLITGLIWDNLPEGIWKILVFFAAMIFLASGAITSAILTDTERQRHDRLPEEEYEELICMIEERRKQLDEKN